MIPACEFLTKESGSSTNFQNLEIVARETIPFMSQPSLKVGPHQLVVSSAHSIENRWISDYIFYTSEASFPEYIHYDRTLTPNQSVIKFNLFPEINKPKISMQISATENSSIDIDSAEIFSENIQSVLQMIVYEYSVGNLDINQILLILGEPWNESSIVLLLELMGAYRPLSLVGLKKNEHESILTKLADIRSSTKFNQFNDNNWINREVVASQRIESVYVSPQQLLNNKT
jgi:hypothetical protein